MSRIANYKNSAETHITRKPQKKHKMEYGTIEFTRELCRYLVTPGLRTVDVDPTVRDFIYGFVVASRKQPLTKAAVDEVLATYEGIWDYSIYERPPVGATGEDLSEFHDARARILAMIDMETGGHLDSMRLLVKLDSKAEHPPAIGPSTLGVYLEPTTDSKEVQENHKRLVNEDIERCKRIPARREADFKETFRDAYNAIKWNDFHYEFVMAHAKRAQDLGLYS